MIIGWLAARPEVPLFAEWNDIATDIEAHIASYL